MLVFELKLIGRTTAKGLARMASGCSVRISEWDMANMIRILKTRNQSLYTQLNGLYDKASEVVSK